MTLKTDATEKTVVDTGSPVTIIPTDAKKKNKKLSSISRKYQDTIKNEVKSAGKIMVEAESKGKRNNSTILITEP